MRRSVLAASLVTASLIVAACSDKSVPTAPVALGGPPSNTTISQDGCRFAPPGYEGAPDPMLWFAYADREVDRIIPNLFVGDNGQSAQSMWGNLQKDKLEGKPIQNHLDNLSKWTIDHLLLSLSGGATTTSGLKDPDGPSGPLNATSGAFYMLSQVFTCLGMTPTTVPEVPAGVDAEFEFVEPNSTTNVVSSLGDAAVLQPGQSLETANGRSLVALVRQKKDDPNAGNVNTPFPKLSETFDVAFAGGKLRAGFNVGVVVCTFTDLSATSDQYNRAVIAHQKPNGDVEYLAREERTYTCPEQVGSAWRMEKGFLRQRSMQVASLVKKALRLVSPRPLYAGHAAIGGSSCCFSPIVVVDPYVETEVVFTNQAGEPLAVDESGRALITTAITYGANVDVKARLRIRDIPANPAVYRGTWVNPDAVTAVVNQTNPGNTNLQMSARVDAGVPVVATTDNISFASWSFPCVNAGGHLTTVNFAQTAVVANAPLYGASSRSATFSVQQRPLTVTANDYDQWIYGNDQEASLTATIAPAGPTGIQTQCGDAGTAVAFTDKDGTTPVGLYPDAIRARIDFTPASTAGNYAVQEVRGDLTVQRRPLVVTIHDKSADYGEAIPALTFATDAVNGDPISVTLVTSPPASQGSLPGDYAINATDVTGDETNYTVVMPIAPGTLRIDPVQFSYASFTSTSAGLTLVEDARLIDGVGLRLTASATDERGAAWRNAKVYVAGGWETNFSFKISQPGSTTGADGLAFVVRGDGSANIGGGGGGIGYSGITPSLAVEFDTWHNTETGATDPDGRHVSIRVQGTPAAEYNFTLGAGVNLEDGATHTVRIVYASGTVTVYLDGTQVASTAVTLPSGLMDGNGKSTVGFTAATGAAIENHDILSWAFRAPPTP